MGFYSVVVDEQDGVLAFEKSAESLCHEATGATTANDYDAVVLN